MDGNQISLAKAQSDSLTNLVSGLGTDRDKAAGAQYALSGQSYVELLTAYKESSLARRVVDLKAEDSCREWREWNGEADQISAIEAEEKRLGVQRKVLKSRKYGRLFGGAALLIGTGDADLAKPLDPKRIAKGGLKYLSILTINDISATALQLDPTKEGFNEPEYWTLRGSLNCHPSRLAFFHGQEPMQEFSMDANLGFGDSVLRGGLKQVQDIDAVAANILSLVYEAKVDVFKIPDLMQNLANRGEEYANEIVKRTRLAAIAKGINGALIMDALEQYEQKSANFANLDKIAAMFMQICAAAHGYPMTLLFGMSAGGLNSTGDNDTRGYYDSVKVEQTLHMEPAMAILDECIVRSALGDRPDEIHYNWRPLWQPTAKERAENADKIASAAQKLHGMEIIPDQALGEAVVNALTETGAFNGLESAVKDYTERAPAENPDDLPDQMI